MDVRLPDAFLSRMRETLGDAFADYMRAMEQPPRRALRINTLKIDAESFEELVDFTITPVVIEKDIEICSDKWEDITNITIINKSELEKSNENDEARDDNANSKAIQLVKYADNQEYNASNCVLGADTIGICRETRDDITNSAQICYLFPDEIAIGRHPAHAAGLCYVQEPSAQVPARLVGARPGMVVLDLCAAPGGKAGQLAEAMENGGLLIANEPVPARAQTLTYNLERLGVRNAVVTNMAPDALCGKLNAQCDAVLADAPCSGEGMFRRDAAAVAEWSGEHVRACAIRQRAILDAADLALRPGGTLVYSTCTFSAEENEDTVEAFLATHPAYELISMRRLYPHTSAGEGQFMAKLRKRGASEGADAAGVRCAAKAAGALKDRPIPEWEAFCEDALTAPPAERALLLPDGRVLLPPRGYEGLPKGLRILRAGVLAGEARQGRFVPAHALTMALPKEAFLRSVSLYGEALAAYFAGEAVPCERGLAGWCAVTYAGYPVGWGKAVHGTLKNHLPKGLRIRG